MGYENVSQERMVEEEREKEKYVLPKLVEYGKLNELTKDGGGEQEDGFTGSGDVTR